MIQSWMHIIISKINDRLLFTEIYWDHIISIRRNNLFLENEYFIIVHKTNILKKIDTKTTFDEIWFVFEYFIMNIFSFLILFVW